MLLVKVPVLVPSVVCSPEVVGFADVLQHTPLPVSVVPPDEVTFPPPVAVLSAIDDAGDV